MIGHRVRATRQEAETRHAEQHVVDLCREYSKVSLPPDLPPPPEALAAWRANPNDDPCSSEKLYLGNAYGGHQVSDYSLPDIKAARACAVLHASWNPEIGRDFEGDQMLAILSANGQGVEQSWPAAMHYACEAVFWGWQMKPLAEVFAGPVFDRANWPNNNGFVLALERAMNDNVARGGFDGCDYPALRNTDNLPGDHGCADFRERMALGAVAAGYADRNAGDDSLARHADRFNDLLMSDASALHMMTAALPAVVDNAAKERGRYDALVAEIARNRYLALTAADLATSDDTLNQLYKYMKCEIGGCPPDPIRANAAVFQEAERSWLAYRDEMVTEAVAGAPSANAGKVKVAVLAQLTRERVETLDRWISRLQGLEPSDISMMSDRK